MNARLGWLLAALFTFAAWRAYGLAGLAFAASAIVFWLLLQFNRALRVMRNAASAPVGHVASAVMFHAGLARGMTMLQIVTSDQEPGPQGRRQRRRLALERRRRQQRRPALRARPPGALADRAPRRARGDEAAAGGADPAA